jgi:hypothetical protein
MEINIGDMIQFSPYLRYRVKDVKTENNSTVITYTSYDDYITEHKIIITKMLISEEELKIVEE